MPQSASFSDRAARAFLPVFALLSMVVGQARGLGIPEQALYYPRSARTRTPWFFRAPQAQQTVPVPFPFVLPLLRTIDSGVLRDFEILARMSGLAREAASGALNTGNRAVLNETFQTTRSVIDLVAQTTSFRDHRVMDGSTNFVLLGQLEPPRATPLILPGFFTEDLGLGASRLNVATVTNATAALSTIDNAVNLLQQARVDLRQTYGLVLNS